MKKNNESTLRLIHLSDIHIKNDEIQLLEFDDRVTALLADIKSNFSDFDYIVISGDLTFYGKKDEYELLHSRLIEKLRIQLHATLKKIITVPGNHDVERVKIDTITKEGLKSKIITTEAAGEYISQDKYTIDFSKNYYEYCRDNLGGHKNLLPFETRTIDHKGIKFAISCMNSAWCCFDDDSEKKIFLSHKQVATQIRATSNYDAKIALMHHGFDWLHPDEHEKPIVSDMKLNYDIIISGHVHKDISISEQTTSSETLNFTGMAFFCGKIESNEGYNIYDIDFENAQVIAFYRKYIRGRKKYDKHTEHAEDGQKTFPLRKDTLPISVQKNLTVQRLGLSSMSNNITTQLKSIQGIENPIFVSPKITEAYIDSGKRKNREFTDTEKLLSANTILYAPPEYGKTIFLESLMFNYNNTSEDGIYVYLDFKDNCYRDQSIEDIIASQISKLSIDDNTAIVFICDHISTDEENILKIHNGGQRDNVKFIIAISNEFLFDKICNNNNYNEIIKLELKPWGMSAIKEFAVKYLKARGIFSENILKALQNSFEHCDLPLTPVIIGMYLSIFSVNDENIKGISLTGLIEKIEKIKLSEDDYNLPKILILLAKHLSLERKKDCNKDVFVNIVNQYYSTKNLSYDLNKIINSFNDSGLLRIENDSVKFTYYIFQDFYTAKALCSRQLSIDEYTSDLNIIIRNGEAISLYGALQREDSQVLDEFLQQIMKHFINSNEEKYDLALLDGFINHLLYPATTSDADADKIAKEDIEKKQNYEKIEDDFEQNRIAHQSTRSAMSDFDDSGVSFINRLILSLKTFYNLLRNLENIDGDRKEEFIDKILDYHMYCNMMLIKFFHTISADKMFQSFAAYLYTMGGQSFLKSEIWSPNLRITIANCIQKSTNDFKKYLLIGLYADGKFPKYIDIIGEFLDSTESPAAIEMLFRRTRQLMIEHESEEIPTALIALFKKIYDKRQKFFHKRQYNDDPQSKRGAVQEVIKAHIKYKWNRYLVKS